MRTQQTWIAGLAAVMAVTSYGIVAQQPAPEPMSFFVTSVGLGDGANLGGLEGADGHCQRLASAAGRGDSAWRAYLSTQGSDGVNARDRIGSGPWFAHGGRRQVAADVGSLHGDTLNQARLGNALGKAIAMTENGDQVNGLGDSPNQHDILTGSLPDGRAFTDGMDHTRAAVGRARPPVDRLRSDTRTSKGAETDRGTRLTPAAAAARRTWWRLAGPGSSIASLSTRLDSYASSCTISMRTSSGPTTNEISMS